MYENTLSYDYIRGLIGGEGSFTFSTTPKKDKEGTIISRSKIPTFAISMHERDVDLIIKIRDTLGLTNKVYIYNNNQKDSHTRGRKALLTVREFSQLKNIIVPFFYNKLQGYKAIQFNEWLEKIGSDTDVSKHFKLIYRLHKSGFYINNSKF
jgi:hypothetical protein